MIDRTDGRIYVNEINTIPGSLSVLSVGVYRAQL